MAPSSRPYERAAVQHLRREDIPDRTEVLDVAARARMARGMELVVPAACAVLGTLDQVLLACRHDRPQAVSVAAKQARDAALHRAKELTPDRALCTDANVTYRAVERAVGRSAGDPGQ